MKNEYDFLTKKTKEISNKKRSFAFNLKRFFKAVLLLCLGAIAYGVSYYFSGFYKTNVRLLTLLVCTALGFLGFFIIYYVISLFAKLSYEKKRKKPIIQECAFIDDLNAMLYSKKYDFIYDFNKTLPENLSVVFDNLKSLVHDVSKKFNKDGKYYYLNCTSKDLLLVFSDVIEGLHDKVDGFFTALNLQDKPLSFVEKRLIDLIEKDKKLTNESFEKENQTGLNKFISKFKENLLNLSGKVTTFIFKTQIEETANGIIKFIGEEAFKVYGQGQISTKRLKGDKPGG